MTGSTHLEEEKMVIPGRTYSVPPLYAQVVVMDSGTTSLPERVSGEEAVLSNESSLIIATRPDEDGDVEMRICEPGSLQTGALIFDGVMDFPSGTPPPARQHSGRIY